ncbi:metal ABC transporter ATP-binding protein [Paucilactobacillus suebicus]|uniref:Zinc iron ABC transporter, ATP-binding protein n=1 Tax=Paucilactobacillus suebicus DSM 5007 = KCTC 3549 TaxID=1423807 RepID=A0A0R1W0Q4_9LACO|nr:zinc iron ABC transporter, ATP-binding protein [Paucilactobacillus suebicus DSM 5007 = KCTC 3549]
MNFNLQPGGFLVIVGENGVGKTTLVRALLGQLRPKSGSIEFNGPKKNVKIGYVPQFRNLDEEYPLSIRDFVGLSLMNRRVPWLGRSEVLRLNDIMNQTNLEKIADRPVGLASGGEKQRAYLAQALINKPELLILDESTASLDNEMKYELLDLVAKFQHSDQLSVIFITHDLPLAQKYADRFLYMEHFKYKTGPIADLPVEQVEGR